MSKGGTVSELSWMTADQVGRAYRDGSLSPVDVVEASLSRIEQVDSKINSMVTVTADEARLQAREAERALRSGDDLPPLFGIPIVVKDLTDTAGVRTTYGSVAFADHVPDTDAVTWSRLKAAGVILIGKTTTPEFGMLGVTDSKLTGTTSTPWDLSRTSGGSSGGSAAATAAGITPVSWGSDGGGSIRVPASFCGTVGFKPTIGRIPTANSGEPDATEGPITRTVVDNALLLDVTVGRDARDRFSLPNTGERYAAAAREHGDLTGVRVAASVDLGYGPIDPEVRRVFEAALDDLRSAGAMVEPVEIDLPDPIDYFLRYWGPEFIGGVELLEGFGAEVWPLIREIAERAARLEPSEVSAAVRATKTSIYNAFGGVLDDFDLMVTATTPTPAFPHAGDLGGVAVVDGVAVDMPGLFFHHLTESPSHAGLPAISVPCGFTVDGLPVGLQIIGAALEDLSVVRAAARYEQATSWTSRRPVL